MAYNLTKKSPYDCFSDEYFEKFFQKPKRGYQFYEDDIESNLNSESNIFMSKSLSKNKMESVLRAPVEFPILEKNYVSEEIESQLTTYLLKKDYSDNDELMDEAKHEKKEPSNYDNHKEEEGKGKIKELFKLRDDPNSLKELDIKVIELFSNSNKLRTLKEFVIMKNRRDFLKVIENEGINNEEELQKKMLELRGEIERAKISSPSKNFFVERLSDLEKIYLLLKENTYESVDANSENDEEIHSIIKNSSPSLCEGSIRKLESLGYGSFGVVNHMVSEQSFALKQIDFKRQLESLDDKEALYDLLRSAFFEFQIMKKNLPNVVRSYQYNFDQKEKVFSFTMDIMKGKDLSTLIKERCLSFEEYFKLFKDILTGKNFSKM